MCCKVPEFMAACTSFVATFLNRRSLFRHQLLIPVTPSMYADDAHGARVKGARSKFDRALKDPSVNQQEKAS